MDKTVPGLVHLYVGDGKGKTTAAIGLAVRAKGAGRKVLIAQFLKGRDTSEIAPLKAIGIKIIRTEEMKKFVFQMNDEELKAASADCESCLSAVETALAGGEYDLIVMDEAVDAVNLRLINTDRLLALIKGRGENVELVLTGRNPDPRLIEVSDYYTEMRAIKHPYKNGVLSRLGVEY